MASSNAEKKQVTPPTNTTTESRASKGQLSTAAIETIRSIVQTLRPFELSNSQRLRTYQAMMLDDAVGNAFGSNAILVEKAFANAEIEYDKNDPEATVAAEFLAYNIANLNGQSLRSIARNSIEFKRDGLAPLEKVFKKNRDKDDWTDFWTLKNLNYIHPLSLNRTQPFTVSNNGNTIKELRQDLNAFQDTNDTLSQYSGVYNKKGYVAIPRNKVVFMTYADTDAQPFGQSPFDVAYNSWREKKLIEDYTLVGVSKDFAGMPVLYMPDNILREADVDPSSASGIMVNTLRNNMANMSSGDQSYTILPSSLSEGSSSVKSYELKFLGIEGSGKNFDVVELIEQRKKAIYNCFGAANLITGETGGSYNLIEGQNGIHAHYIERDISVIEEGLNKDVIPQLFRLNGWKLPHNKLPKIKAGEIEPLSADESGKFIQRVASVGMMPLVPETVNYFLKTAGVPYQVPQDMSTDDLREIMTNYISNSGEGFGTSGTGSSQNGGASSATNSDNKA